MNKDQHSRGCTQRKRNSMEGLLFSVLLLSVVQSIFADTTGGSRNSLATKLAEMCKSSKERLYDRMQENPRFFPEWIEELPPLDREERGTHYFYDRPVDTPQNSICQPMNTTCCRRRTEKHLIQLAQKEYGELFLNVTYEHIGGCLRVGRHFYHAMYSNFIEIRRQMEIPINNQLDGKLREDLFDDFFSYISSFSVTSNLCDLPLQLKAAMLELFTLIYDGQYGDSLHQVHSKCYENVSMHIMTSHYNKLFVSLERQLYNLDLIFRAMRMSETIVQSLKRHRFSTTCTKPLTQLQNCGHCTGYVKFKPCLFYCLNVLKGCFADVADVHREFQLLTKALSDIPDDILGTFQPEAFIGESLLHFIHLTEDLIGRDLKREVADACNHQGTDRQKRTQSQHRRQTSNLAAVTPTSTQEDDSLSAAFSLELQCMEDIVALLRSIPEQMCYQSKQHKTIADTGNHRCWTGSRMGTYFHALISSRKEDQVDNSEFRGGPPPYLNQYTNLCMDISTIAAEVNETLDLTLCLDDEDCLTAPFYICEEEDLEAFYSGSGFNTSGSGSGRLIDDGMRDMEDGDSPQIDEDDDVTEVTKPEKTPVLTSTPPSTEGSTGEGYTVIDIEKVGSGENAADNTNTTNETSAIPETPNVTVTVLGGDEGAGFTGSVQGVVGSSTRLGGSIYSLLTTATAVLICTISGLC